MNENRKRERNKKEITQMFLGTVDENVCYRNVESVGRERDTWESPEWT